MSERTYSERALSTSFLCTLLPALFVAAGCSSAGPHVVQPGYEQPVGASASLGALLLSTKSSAAPNASAGSDAGGKASQSALSFTKQGRKVLQQFYGQILSDILVADVQTSTRSDTLSLTYQSLSLPGGEASMVAPVPSGTLDLYAENPRFLLLLGDLYFGLSTKKDYGSNLVATEVTYDYVLRGQYNYLLWDNRAGAIAAYGQVRQSVASPATPSTRDYLDLFWKLATEMGEATPLTLSSSQAP